MVTTTARLQARVVLAHEDQMRNASAEAFYQPNPRTVLSRVRSK